MRELSRIGEQVNGILRPRRFVTGRVRAVKRNVFTGEITVYEADNIVTNDGDLYYAQMGAGETPTNDFGAASSEIVVLDGAGAAPGKASNWSNIGAAIGTGNPQAFDTNYPKTNDGDADNPSAATDTVTYLVSYATGEANGTIVRVAIHLTGASGTDPILMYAALAVTKTSADTLKVFVNHNMAGI